MAGAIYQLMPKRLARRIRSERELQSVLRQNYIINWLTVADLLATIGILIRSTVWLVDEVDGNRGDEGDCERKFCAISSGWIQFFYLATFFWTLFFALDTYLLTVNKQSHQRLYHLLSWGVPVVLCLVGLLPLYLPSLSECTKDVAHLLPNFLFTYIPLLVTMVANPILYTKASNAVLVHMYGSGSFTDREREIIRSMRMRFRAIIIAFYVCWLPTLISGLFTAPLFRQYGLRNVSMCVLLLTAVLNPLQGFLNSLLYKGVGLCPNRYLTMIDHDQRVTTNDTESSTRLQDSAENTPLLRE